MSRMIEMKDKEFGRLTVIKRAKNDANGRARWWCECKCGRMCIRVGGKELRSGNTTSCGCYFEEMIKEGRARYKHGGARRGKTEKLFVMWAGMKARCENPGHKSYSYYGGRGITVCDEWQDYATFRDWAEGNSYAPGLELDRRKNDLGYSPDNCRWVPKVVNIRNQDQIKLSIGIAREIRSKYAEGGISQWALAAEHGVSRPVIKAIIDYEIWQEAI